MNTITHIAACVVATIAASVGVAAHAAKKPLSVHPTDVEILRLPPYCKAKLRGSPEEKKAWDQQMGREIFQHVHHYCNGLNELSRARMEPDRKIRSFYLKRSISNFDYVIKAWPASYQLTAQASRLKSQAESMQMRR